MHRRLITNRERCFHIFFRLNPTSLSHLRKCEVLPLSWVVPWLRLVGTLMEPRLPRTERRRPRGSPHGNCCSMLTSPHFGGVHNVANELPTNGKRLDLLRLW